MDPWDIRDVEPIETLQSNSQCFLNVWERFIVIVAVLVYIIKILIDVQTEESNKVLPNEQKDKRTNYTTE